MGVKCIVLCSKCICNALQESFSYEGTKIYLLNFEEESDFESLLSCAISLYCSGFRFSQASCVYVLKRVTFYFLKSFCWKFNTKQRFYLTSSWSLFLIVRRCNFTTSPNTSRAGPEVEANTWITVIEHFQIVK